MPRQPAIDPGTMQTVLDGLEVQRTRIGDKIAALRSMLEGGSRSPSPKKKRRRKYRISKEGRARIGAATRKRWRALKKAARAKRAS